MTSFIWEKVFQLFSFPFVIKLANISHFSLKTNQVELLERFVTVVIRDSPLCGAIITGDPYILLSATHPFFH